MKKLIYLLFILIFLSTIAFCISQGENKNEKINTIIETPYGNIPMLDNGYYPETTQEAYNIIFSIQKLPYGKYKKNDKRKQLDISKLDSSIKLIFEDGEIYRDLSGTVSAQNEVIKDLIARMEKLEKNK